MDDILPINKNCKEAAMFSVDMLSVGQKLFTREDAGRVLTYLECGDFMINGKDQPEELVRLKLKLRLWHTGVVEYSANIGEDND